MAKITVLVLASSIVFSHGIFASGQLYFLPDVQDVTSVSWSPDGDHILSSGFDGTIRLWKADTCESGPFIYIDDPRVPEGEDAFRSLRRGVMSVAWSPDGKRFVAGLRDRTVRLYQLEWEDRLGPSFEEIETFTVEGQGGLRTVAYSADGRMVASAGHDGSVRLWDAKKHGTMIREFKGHSDMVEAVIFSHDAKMLISAGEDGTIKTWDVATGQIKSSLTAPGPISALALSRDGQLVAGAITRPDKQHFNVLVWGVRNWQVAQTIDIPDRGKSLSFNRDGNHVAIAMWGRSEGTVWSIESGKFLFKFLSPLDQGIRGISYSPDGNYIAVGQEPGTPFLINSSTGEIVREFGKCSAPRERRKE
jgi:WD40 repeat protein